MAEVEPTESLSVERLCNRSGITTTSTGMTVATDTGDLDLGDPWQYTYSSGEVIWGIILAVGIFGVNFWVLWVVMHSRELWKPRHLWMACLCVTDLFVGVHKVIELLLLVLPRTMKLLCIVNKATLGIPYILNILVLTLLSLDRYIAVSHPFLYSSSASNRHVGVGFVFVLLVGVGLSWSSIAIGLEDVVCRVHFLQLKYLIAALALCSLLTLFFNVSVLRIAKKHLTAIYTSGATRVKPRPLSVVCTNCGHQTVALSAVAVPGVCTDSDDKINDLTLSDVKSEVTPFLETTIALPTQIFEKIENPLYCSEEVPNVGNEIFRAQSLPEMSTPSKQMNPILQTSTTASAKCRVGENETANERTLPRRCRSLFSFNSLNARRHTNLPSVQFFRHLHFTRTHAFHVGRLFPSIRFARTVLFIMIPMWIFILPVITIIPLRRSCELEPTRSGCSVVDTLWKYLLVHIRSVLLLQAILDTVIYACRSKEFKNALRRIYKREKYVDKK